LGSVRYWFTDTCCQGSRDVTQNILVAVMPGLTRAPYLDLWHAIHRLTDATNGPQHPLHEAFCGRIGEAFYTDYAPDVARVTARLAALNQPVSKVKSE
jgi:hypothetical protein